MIFFSVLGSKCQVSGLILGSKNAIFLGKNYKKKFSLSEKYFISEKLKKYLGNFVKSFSLYIFCLLIAGKKFYF